MSRTLGVEQNYADEDACCCVCGDDLEEADPKVGPAPVDLKLIKQA